ncbi:MAG: CPBP family intramembrane metalloprotease [Thermoanaerobaculia bacterium]|nr:CPBP family intramembrane metalloprotease [Thermoanaerobaculia bacterium]
MNLRTLAVGYSAFVAAVLLPRLLEMTSAQGFLDEHPTAPHFVVKTALLAFVLVAIHWSPRSAGDFGFARPKAPTGWIRCLGIGALLGATATALILSTPAQGMPNLRNFGFLGLILSIWLYSSLVEELFVRGWLQSSLDPATTPGRRIALSGLFFGSMHLSLIAAGADWMTVLIIVGTTTLLGLLTAQLRENTKSLLPPLAAHVAFNVGGFAAGVLINIVHFALTGAPIQP